MNELTITKELAGLDKSKAKQIEAVFAPMVEMVKGFEATYDQIEALEISPDKCAKAKRLRLDIGQVRIKADQVRKVQKEEYLRAGNAIQGVYNILKFAVVDKEEKLKDMETHYERIEAEKKENLAEAREVELSKYDVDGTVLDLGNMDDVVWGNFLAGAKSNYEAVREAERKAAQELIRQQKRDEVYSERQTDLIPFAQFGALDLLTRETTADEYTQLFSDMKGKLESYEKEQAEIRAENERLKKEQEKAEEIRLAEQKKQDAKVQAEKEKLERVQAEAEAEKRIQDEVIRKEREAKEKLERELAEKKAAEERARLEAEQAAEDEAKRLIAKKEKAVLAPDKEKLEIIAADLKNRIPLVKSFEAKQAIQTACSIILKASLKM